MSKRKQTKLRVFCGNHTFSFIAEYYKKPKDFISYYNSVNDQAYLARPSSMNGRKRNTYVVSIHITPDDIKQLIEKKLKEKNLEIPDEIM